MRHTPLTPAARRHQTQWAEEQQHWVAEQWHSVLFSDESRSCLHPNNQHLCIWRERGTRNNPNFAINRYPYGGGGLMVWGSISIGGSTDLYVVDGRSLSGVRYRDEILNPLVVSYAEAVGETFILLDDNARAHRAGVVDNMLEEQGIQRMNFPARLPDLNPTEHAWDALGRRLQIIRTLQRPYNNYNSASWNNGNKFSKRAWTTSYCPCQTGEKLYWLWQAIRPHISGMFFRFFIFLLRANTLSALKKCNVFIYGFIYCLR